MSLLHPSLQEQAILHAVQNTDKDDRQHVRSHDVKPDSEPKPKVWAVMAAKKHPRLYKIFSLFVTFGLIAFILIAVIEFLF